jgi:hypothetical protein
MRRRRAWEAVSHLRSKIRLRLRRWRSWRGEPSLDEEIDLADGPPRAVGEIEGAGPLDEALPGLERETPEPLSWETKPGSPEAIDDQEGPIPRTHRMRRGIGSRQR